MSELKATPGPWSACPDEFITANGGNAVAKAYRIAGGFGDDAERDANKALIASAPEMYEALDACRSLLLPKVDQALAAQVDAALAKARGETL